MAIIFLSSKVLASSVSDVKQGEILDTNITTINGEYLSSVFETEYEYNVLGLAWQSILNENIQPWQENETTVFYIRIYDSNGWNEWNKAEDFIVKGNWYYLYEPILADKGTRLQYKVVSREKINKVKLIYLGEGSNIVFKNQSFLNQNFIKSATADGINIVSRSEWGADENWRLDTKGNEIWPTQYQMPKKFIIHHTAGNDGGNNPEGVLKGIYYWHAIVLGWGDIGYNYIIDQNGTIYEGRYGGDGVIGAHAYRSKTCAKSRFGDEKLEADFNKGSIGIAILGDYESNEKLTKKVKDALANLIAVKAKDFGIEPDGESYFIDNKYPNIVGHKDVDCTACPGKNLYNKLDEIRTLAQQEYESLGGAVDPIIKATFVRESDKSVVIKAGEEKEVWVEFRNDGNVTWRSYGKNQPYIILKENADSDLRGSDWGTDNKVTTLETSNVAPGEIGRFVFTLKAPTDRLKDSEDFMLSFDDKVEIGTDFNINVEITGLPYAAELDNRSINQAMFINDTQDVKLQFRNKGANTWKRGEVKLNIYDLNDKISQLVNQSWPSDWGQIDFNEAEVKTDELATFNFTLKAPSKLGVFKNIYRLVGDQDIIQQEGFSVTRIDSKYQAEMISHNIPLAILNYWRLPVVVKYRNTGLAPWDRSMILNIYDLGGTASKFKDSSWDSQYGRFVLEEREVKPGEIGTFKFVINGPKKKGIYLQILKLEIEGKNTIIQNGEVHLLTRVD